jgi:actin-related protein 6
LNIGGKFLTNHLKEVISYRHYNMMDETHLINKVKESCCFVSQDFNADLEKVRRKQGEEMKYVLPDYNNNKEGYILREGQMLREDQQVLVLGNERFAIPEVLFTPSDIGMSRGFPPDTGSKQGGLAEAVMQSIEASPEELRSLLLANIVLVGGSTNIPGFSDRLYRPT